MKRCRTCGLTLPLDDFYRRRTTKDGRSGACKRCDSARTQRNRARRIAELGETEVRRREAEATRRWRTDPTNRAKETAYNTAYTWALVELADRHRDEFDELKRLYRSQIETAS